MASVKLLKKTPKATPSNANFRQALGQFCTGVTVVTCRDVDGPKGMTANSFNSVSLNPPLVLWSAAKASRRFDTFAAADQFSIHVLQQAQRNISEAFVKDDAPFGTLEWQADSRQVPILPHCLARFDCHLHTQHDAGDHMIIVGHVDHFEAVGGRPLVFSQGGYTGLA